MKIKKLLFLLLLVSSYYLKSQESGATGKEFWLTYTENLSNYLSNNYQYHCNFRIYISADQNSLVTIANPNTSYTKTVFVAAGTMHIDSIPLTECYNEGSGNILEKGIKITATSEISLYAVNQTSGSYEGTAILPRTSLGLRYRVMSYAARYPGSYGIDRSEFCVLALEDSTILNIIPSDFTMDNKNPGTTYTIVLNKGQTYQLKAKDWNMDLTGSLVESQNCKPITVFGGCANAGVHCFGAGNLYEQLFPIETWGREFILIPTSTHIKDVYVILANQSNTNVTINGNLINLANAGDKYDAEILDPLYIVSNKPVCICLYGVGYQCSGNDGNSFMMWISPLGQRLKNARFSAVRSVISQGTLSRQFVNIVSRTSAVSSIKLNGASISASFQPVIYNTKFSYIRIGIPDSVSTITSDSNFAAYSYGYGQGGGYGFNVGSSSHELERYFTINGIKNDDFGKPEQAFRICKNTSNNFKGYSGNYIPKYWHWVFGNDTLNSQNVIKSFADTGLIKVMLITGRNNPLCNSDTASDTSFQYIRIVNPEVNILDTFVNVCSGNSYQISVNYSGDSTIRWRISTDLSCDDCAEPIITPSFSQWYKVTIGGNGLNCSMSDSIYIHVLDSIRFSKQCDSVICQGSNAIITTSILNPDTSVVYTYSLYKDTSLFMQNNSGNFAWQADSSVKLLLKINNGCSDFTDSIYIRVIPKIDLKYFIDTIYPKCINSDLKLTISTQYSDGILVRWGDGSDTMLLGNSHTLVHKYNTLGTMNISIVANADFCLDSTSVLIIVRNPIQFSAAANTIICKGTTANLWATATGGDSVFTYIIKSGTYQMQNTTGLFPVTPDTTTTFFLGGISACAKDTIWKAVTVIVNPALSLKLNSVDTTICKGANYNIIATATGGNGFYQYALKKNIIIQQTNTTGSFNITATANEIYTVVLTDNCTVLNDSLTVNIKLFPDLKFTQTIPDAYLCPGEGITLKANTNNGSGAVTYEWKDGSGTILTLTDSLQITPFTTNQIILKVTDACTSIYDTILLNQFAVAGGTQLNSDVQSGCVPLTVNFETPNLTHSNAQRCEAIWDFGDGNTQTQNFDNSNNLIKTKHVYTLPGIFTATVKLKFKNRATECYTFTNTIESLDIPQIQLLVTPKKITLPKTQCTATVTTTNADSVVIEWGDGYSDNFNSSVNFISHTHDYSDTGHYTIKATAYNKNTCYIETFAKVFHADTFMCFIPNAFTANKDNLNETFKPVVSYCKSYELVIFNRWGEEVYRENYTAGKNTMVGWNGEGQVADTYVYMLTTKDGDNNRRSFKGTVILLR